MVDLLRNIAALNGLDIGVAFEFIPVIDYSLRKLEQCTNLIVPSLFKGNKRIVQDNITPILKNLAIAGSLYRHGSRELSASKRDLTGIVYMLTKELLCLTYLSEQYIKTLINIKINMEPIKSPEFKEVSASKGIGSQEKESKWEKMESNHSFRTDAALPA